MRTATIRVPNDLSVVAGDRVDVLITTATKQRQTTTMLQNAKVVAADQNTRVVTLLVSAEDAQKIMNASEGKSTLRLWKSD